MPKDEGMLFVFYVSAFSCNFVVTSTVQYKN